MLQHVLAGLAHLVDLQQLTQLDLAYTVITDAGVSNLQQLTSLLDLNLDSTSLTDRWVMAFCNTVLGAVGPTPCLGLTWDRWVMGLSKIVLRS